MRIRAVLFDLDGTLLDTLDDLTDSVNAALAGFGFAPRTRDEVRRFVGNGVRRLIGRAVPEGTPEEAVLRCLERFRAHYAGNLANRTKPYPGVEGALADLKASGLRTAVVSNKYDGAVKSLCAKYFGGALDAAVGETGGIARKPDPALLFAALDMLRACREEAVYIGDSDIDVNTAANAGIPCIACSWGFRSRESLLAAHPAAIADSPSEWMDILKGLNL